MAQREYPAILVDVYHCEKGKWTFSTYGLEDEVELESIGVQFMVNDVYKKTGLMRGRKK